MNMYIATEAAYLNGYDAGKSAAAEQIFEELTSFISECNTGIYSPRGNYLGKGVYLDLLKDKLAELKKKYESETNDGA